MPITGNRASDECKTCSRDRTECGNCKYLRLDRRQTDRRSGEEVDNFIMRPERSATVGSAEIVQ